MANGSWRAYTLVHAIACASTVAEPRRIPLKNSGNAQYTADSVLFLSQASSARADTRHALSSVGAASATERNLQNDGSQSGASLLSALESVVGSAPENRVRSAWEAAESSVARVTAFFDKGVPAPERLTRAANETIMAAIRASKQTSLLQIGDVRSFSVCIGASPGSDGALTLDDDAPSRLPALFARVPLEGEGGGARTADLAAARLLAPGPAGGPERAVELGCARGCRASFDSAVSLLAAPRSAVARLRAALPALLQDCANLTGFPDLSFELGGVRLALPPRAYMSAVSGEVPDDLRAALGLADGAEAAHCQPLLAESADDRTWTLGVPFFQHFYATFAEQGRAVFVAPHPASACEPAAHDQSPQGTGHPVRRVEAQKIRLPSRE